MTHNTPSLWTFYKGWDNYQNLLVKAIEPLTAEQLELKISPNLRTIGSLARHIIRTRATWLNNLMGEGGPGIASIAQWPHEGDTPPTSELVHTLKITFQAWQQCLSAGPPKTWNTSSEANVLANHTNSHASGSSGTSSSTTSTTEVNSPFLLAPTASPPPISSRLESALGSAYIFSIELFSLNTSASRGVSCWRILKIFSCSARTKRI